MGFQSSALVPEGISLCARENRKYLRENDRAGRQQQKSPRKAKLQLPHRRKFIDSPQEVFSHQVFRLFAARALVSLFCSPHPTRFCRSRKDFAWDFVPLLSKTRMWFTVLDINPAYGRQFFAVRRRKNSLKSHERRKLANLTEIFFLRTVGIKVSIHMLWLELCSQAFHD